MSTPLSRIGKSLIKYFKPIRVTPPHRFEQHPDSSSGFSSPQKQQPQKTIVLKAKKDFQSVKLDNLPEPAPLKPDAEKPSHWLDLVVYLLAACKRVSEKMKKKSGFETYQKTQTDRGKQKFQSVGSIIDTVPLATDLSDEKKRVA
jgi:hypothetical protein